MRAAFFRWWRWMTVRSETGSSFWAVLGWWERRRLSYNLFLATLAIPAFLLLIALVLLLPYQGDGDLGDPFLAILAIPVLANICYTAGWFVEGILLRRAPDKPDGPKLMRAGLAFSAFVAFAPSLAVIVMAILHLTGWR
jgi:hypothetical protein